MGERLLFTLFFPGITNSLEGHMTSSRPLLSYEDCFYVICRSTPPTRPPPSISFLFSLPSGGENSNELDRSEFVIPSLFVLVWVANLDALYLH